MSSRIEKALAAASETRALHIGENIARQAAEMFRSQFPNKKAVIIADKNTYAIAGQTVEQSLRDAGIEQLEPYILIDPNLYAEFRFVEQLDSALALHDAIPIAVGSGTINDLTKLSSHRNNRRYMCVATAASMDGYTAFGASITFQGAKQTFDCPAPLAVLADTHIVARAPKKMTASGYADLFAKITAGADWILADALGVEPIDQFAWSVVQDGLKEALADHVAIYSGNEQMIAHLTEGLMLGGFAMQASQSSRPASGAEHQFSHLWDMEHHKFNGVTPSHGFKVSIGMLAITALYEQVLSTDLSKLDVDAACSAWLEPHDAEAIALEMFADSDFPTIGVTETSAKYIDRKALHTQLSALKNSWPEIHAKLTQQIVPYKEVKRRLELVGAPTEPEQIGISRQRLRQTFIRAQHIRRRFTVLDLAVRTGLLDRWLEGLFGKGAIWEIEQK